MIIRQKQKEESRKEAAEWRKFYVRKYHRRRFY